MSKTALLPIADGSEELEAVTIIDVLRRAGTELTIASVADISVTMSRGTKLVADAPIEVCSGNEYDLIVLPGGMPGAEHLRDSRILTEMLKTQAEARRLYAAICASPAIVLASHGLMAGKKGTCYPGLEHSLADSYLEGEDVVADGNCITSRGPGTAMAFALKLAELLEGKENAEKTAQGMLVK
ncbi:Chaperone protein YajL [Sedimentisphaera cyanobacteriorum]|uniref:Chaperone protein YajL n=1 Tax=Sedimentisphaera cyanobacteriorum TaxID=1940790 RepID=A0A1Q2HPM1_9BACT|nr:DJ-1 family glyoxalase III [Sedimentisphaera cyanobacteriorum]AQQ09196.1 Chaperone protein YajL [Sedimentisphaera cyanobacteriorum]